MVDPRHHILLVEDDAFAREALLTLLTDDGYRVTAVADGVQAYQAACADPPALVISDVEMPHGGGFDLVRRLRTHTATAHVPIVLVSALSEPNRRVHGLDLGADDFVAKPVDYDELLARVRAHLRRAEEREVLERRAMIDPLTGVLNRRGVSAALQRELRRARASHAPLSLLMIDVDRFKALNDTYGHQTGDTVLRHVASALTGAVRAVDHVGRYGGDEFVVILPDTAAGPAAALADRLRKVRLPALAVSSAGELEVTISIGAATLDDADTAERLVERADQAMYRAKRKTGEPPLSGAGS